jgi:DNA-binding protein H-NS
MPTLQALLDQKAALERQISAERRASRAEAIAQIRTLLAQHGLSPADLSAPMQKHAAGAHTPSRPKVAPKYRHPETGATWTGRGLNPKWLTEQLANGKQLSDFAI